MEYDPRFHQDKATPAGVVWSHYLNGKGWNYTLPWERQWLSTLPSDQRRGRTAADVYIEEYEE